MGSCHSATHTLTRSSALATLPGEEVRLGEPALALSDQSTADRDTLNPNSPIAFLIEGPCLLCAILLVPLQLMHIVSGLLAPHVLQGEGWQQSAVTATGTRAASCRTGPTAPWEERICPYLSLLQLQCCLQLIPKGTQLLLLLILPDLQLQDTESSPWGGGDHCMPAPGKLRPPHTPQPSPPPWARGTRSPTLSWEVAEQRAI